MVFGRCGEGGRLGIGKVGGFCIVEGWGRLRRGFYKYLFRGKKKKVKNNNNNNQYLTLRRLEKFV